MLLSRTLDAQTCYPYDDSPAWPPPPFHVMFELLRNLRTRLFLSFAFPLALAGGCSSGPESSASGADRPPDVYLVIIDSLRADHLSLYGYDHPTSPELDAWAQDAVVFDHAHSAAPWTLPSIASVMTGHHPEALGIREHQTAVPAAVTTLGELYEDAGYDTRAVVSHIYLEPKFGLMQGIAHVNTDMVKGHHEIVSSDGVTDRALAYLRDHMLHEPDQPLFMVTHYFDPHYNYINHPEIYDAWPDYPGPLKSGMKCGEVRHLMGTLQGQQRTDAIRYLAGVYDSEIRYTDHQLARYFRGIERAGRADHALFIVMGDHGDELGDRPDRWVGHTKVGTEDVLHVPLVLKLPDGEQPRARIETPVSLVDLMPTIARYSDLELPADLPVFGNALDLEHPEGARKVLHAETGRWAHLQVAMQGQWKLVTDTAHGTTELFDLAKDPGEHTDVSRQDAPVVARMSTELATWNEAVQADRTLVQPNGAEPPLRDDEIQALQAMGYMQ